jgi:signal transduction histidine kinase
LSLIGLEVLPPLQADPRRIHQIFKHLIGNAIKYTPDGGEITVSGQSEPGRVRITIKDTGVGIAPEDLEKVFEKFYRVGDSKLHSSGETKFMGAGPGLGLAIVKGLVEAHGGRIWAESPGFDMQNHPGSTFVVILPTPNTL